MIEASALKFNRGDYSTLGPGSTIEYKTPFGETLAYIDYSEDGTQAAATIFTPANGNERRYGMRPAGRALQIVLNHLHRQGYDAPDFDTIEDAGNVTAEADAARAAARGQLDPAAVESGDPVAVEAFTAPQGTYRGDGSREDAEVLQAESRVLEDAGLELAGPVAAGTMGPFPAPPAPVHIPAGLPAAAAAAAPADAGIRMSLQPGAAAAPQPGEALQGGAFGSVSEAADAVLGEPADDVVRHWISSGGTVYQLHLRAIVPPAETADALREFVGSDARGYTRGADGRISLWSRHAWNVGYALVLPA